MEQTPELKKLMDQFSRQVNGIQQTYTQLKKLVNKEAPQQQSVSGQ